MGGKPGHLYIVATPIGNLGDMVPRAIEVLKAADWIAAEDTRHSGKLTSHFDIDTPMIPFHDHSSDRDLDRILALLDQGQTVALISDAGTPLISDPGYLLVREARARGVGVTPIPGSCAAIAALSAAGLPCSQFAFEGFLPARESARRRVLESLAADTRTLVFYEAPHRILQTLESMVAVWGEDREAVVARELTKTHETFLAGTLSELVSLVAADSNQQRGEIVLMVRGLDAREQSGDDEEQRRVLSVLMEELPLKQSAALAARITGGNKNQLYQLALALRDES